MKLNKQGNLVSIDGGYNRSCTNISYDNQNRVYYFVDKSAQYQISYESDQVQCVTVNFGNTIGKQGGQFSYEYNEHGDVKRILYSPNPNRRYYIEVLKTEAVDKVYSFEYIYDEHGNWTKRITLIDGKYESMTLRIISYY